MNARQTLPRNDLALPLYAVERYNARYGIW